MTKKSSIQSFQSHVLSSNNNLIDTTK